MPRTDEDVSADRRAFLQQGSALAAAAAVFASGRSGSVWASTDADPATYHPVTLTEDELTTLRSLMARLLPADARSGGAVEFGAHIYVDRELGKTYAHMLPIYRSGLAAIAELARKAAAASSPLSPQRFDAILADMAAGKSAAALDEGGRTFFGMLHLHTMEGCFGDPMYGGNREMLGWQLIGFPGVQLYVSPNDREIDAPARKPTHSAATYGGEPT